MAKVQKRAKKASAKSDSEKLDQIIELLQMNVAVELFRAGVNQKEIAKRLGIGNSTANNILKGVKKDSL